MGGGRGRSRRQVLRLALHELEHVEEAVVAAGREALLQAQHLDKGGLHLKEVQVWGWA